MTADEIKIIINEAIEFDSYGEWEKGFALLEEKFPGVKRFVADSIPKPDCHLNPAHFKISIMCMLFELFFPEDGEQYPPPDEDKIVPHVCHTSDCSNIIGPYCPNCQRLWES